jgi:hypothetical protein
MKKKMGRDPRGSHGKDVFGCGEYGCHGALCRARARAKSQAEEIQYRKTLAANPGKLILPPTEDMDEVEVTPENLEHFLQFREYFQAFAQVATGNKDLPWILERIKSDKRYSGILLLNKTLTPEALKAAYEQEKQKNLHFWNRIGFCSDHEAILSNPNMPSEVIGDLLQFASEPEQVALVRSHPNFRNKD